MQQERSVRMITAHDSKKRIRRYRCWTDPLGEGTGSVVYEADRLPNDAGENDEVVGAHATRRVALKVCTKPTWQGRLKQEAEHLAALQKQDQLPGDRYRIVRVRDDGELLELTEGMVGVALELEFLDGTTLATWMHDEWAVRRAELSPQEIVTEVLGVVGELAEALAQIAELGDGLVHRDVKPENVMRTSQGLRLFDFNVSKEVEEQGMTQEVGTLQYRAPEVVDGQPYDQRADLWSAGVVAWELVHGQRFDRLADCEERGEGALALRWPTREAEALPERERATLEALFGALLVDADRRADSARALIDLVADLLAPYERASIEEQLQELDLISLLFELRPGGLAAVVADTSATVGEQRIQQFLQGRMHVEDPLENWLEQEIRGLVAQDRQGPALIVLAGNAGDGKSHLLRRVMRQRLASSPGVTEHVRYVADATHALSPDASQVERLADFFEPFADEDVSADRRVHVIAMNTGMVIRFFEGEQGARWGRLYELLRGHLGLRELEDDEGEAPWPLQVVNLDLREMVRADEGSASFFERMLDRLRPDLDGGLVAGKAPACAACSARALCPVRYNLEALAQDRPRRALLALLRQASLDPEVHLSPRNLWGFLYRLTTGGAERYDGATEVGGPCELVRRKVADAAGVDGDWFLAGQLTEVLFSQREAERPWPTLVGLDPAFVAAPPLDDLHTRLTIRAELDNDANLVGRMGGTDATVAGLNLRILATHLSADAPRRDAAVRRAAFFAAEEQNAWLDAEEEAEYEALLSAYEGWSRETPLNEAGKQALRNLRDLIQEVFLLGAGRRRGAADYFRVSQPNARGKNELLVAADPASLNRVFQLHSLLVPDVHVAAHRHRMQVVRLLGYAPRTVTIEVAGVRVTVDRRMFGFLKRVGGGQKPSLRDLAGFQALVFIGDRLGNELAADEQGRRELFVWSPEGEKLHKLRRDDFGEPMLEEV